MTVKLLENVTEHAFRFNAITVFNPGESVAVTEETIKAFPAIELLIKRGDLKVVGAQNEPKKEEADEIVED